MIATEPLVTSSARPKLIPSDWDLLLTEIVAHPEVPCFIVAPAGFGKTSLLTALTQRYGASGKTSWIGGTRTELLAELSGEQDARDRLIIIDDFSFLDSEQAEAFSNELDTLIERGARLVVSCTPEHDCFGALQSDRLLIDSMRLCAATRTPTAPTAPTSPAATQAPTSPASPTSPVSPAHTSAHTSTHTSEHTSPYEPDTLQELAVDPAAPATSADEGIPVLDLRFFGDLVIWRKGRRIEAELMRRGKVRSLFILLALNLGRSVARETILERLWPEKSRDAAIENFYTTWSRLAVILGGGDSGAKNSPYLSCDRQVCRLNPTYVKLDLVEFETLAKVVLFWQGTREDRIEAVYRMERLYRGDLLAAISHDSSVQALRERYRTLQVDALLTAAQLFCEIDNESTAIWFARLAFDLDPSREDVYLALMDMLGRMGQRTSAVRAYQDCKRYLEEKLGLAPSQKTTDLYQELILGSR